MVIWGIPVDEGADVFIAVEVEGKRLQLVERPGGLDALDLVADRRRLFEHNGHDLTALEGRFIRVRG